MSDIITASDPSRLPWEMTLAEIIDAAAERHPDKVFLRYDKYAVTYGEFQEATRRVAQTFSRLGVGRGDRVCLFLPNGREVLFIWMGLARLGAICVTVNTAYKQDETAYIIDNSESKVLVTHESLLDVARSAAAQCPSLEASILVSGGSDLPEGWLDFWDLMDSAPAEGPARAYGSGPRRRSHAGVHLRHHGEPEGRHADPQHVRGVRSGFRNVDRVHARRAVLHLHALLPRQCPVLLDNGDPVSWRNTHGGGQVQRQPLLGPGEGVRVHGRQLHRHDDARAPQAGLVAVGPGQQRAPLLRLARDGPGDA